MIRKIVKNYHQSKRRLTWALFRKRHILNRDIKRYIEEQVKHGDVKFHFCCGDNKFPDYINVDIVPLEGTDITMNIPEDLHFIPSEVSSEIRIDSGFEHFYRYQLAPFLRESHRILKDDGKLFINWLPDFDLIIDAYLNKKKGNVSELFDLTEVYRLTHGDPKPENSPHQLHKNIFTKDSVKNLFESNGFFIEKVSNEVFAGENVVVTMNLTAKKVKSL